MSSATIGTSGRVAHPSLPRIELRSHTHELPACSRKGDQVHHASPHLSQHPVPCFTHALGSRPGAGSPIIEDENINQVTVHAPIDDETIAAYEKLGAVYGGFMAGGRIVGFLPFIPGAEGASKGVPGFWFIELPKDRLKNLPEVKVPFGLDFRRMNGSRTFVTDADLFDITTLKNLTMLGLERNHTVTDAGLKNLAPLKHTKPYSVT
jgi:hypothetical protein